MTRCLPLILFVIALPAQDGARSYSSRCAACHGGNGEGGERGPSITSRVALRSDSELLALFRTGIAAAGMPPILMPAEESAALVKHLRTLKPRQRQTVALPLPSFDAARSTDWPSYHGDASGNRHSPLAQINLANISRLRPAWIYPMTGSRRLQTTPVVQNGIMYVTSGNEVHALDSTSGRLLWQYRRPLTRGVAGDAAGGINRGVALHGDRLFFVTDHAHLVCLNRRNGALLWEVEMADSRQNYGATGAPLTVGDVVITGISGGDEGVRGFLDAYRVDTGQRAWRFWTVPARGEPLADTWRGTALEHGCAATWMTGTYDPALDLLYWTAGNPCPDYNGDERQGDNLYSDSVLALRPKTGALVWHFQFTPHDLHDWDAQQTPLLVDAEYRGQQRRLLLQANRNGFFYVLDRATGEFLSATPFVDRLTWASGVDSKGRPIVRPEANPTPQGVRACPAVEGATNWFSTAYNASTQLYYVQALEKCTVYTKTPGKWEAGKSYYDGDTRAVPDETGQKVLRALDPGTGKRIWELKQEGGANSWGGVLSTAGGLVFFGADDGSFSAVDAATGKLVWRFPLNTLWKASPMTYRVDGKQYVAIAASGFVIAFTPDTASDPVPTAP
jgi:alcohol dehydrogenase (cytochrome c)